jgi:chromosome segregation ATPase
MTSVTNELLNELLKRIQQDISDMKRVQQEHTMEFVSIRKHFAAADGRIGALQQDILNVQDRMDSVRDRRSRIERRLDIVEDPVS